MSPPFTQPRDRRKVAEETTSRAASSLCKSSLASGTAEAHSQDGRAIVDQSVESAALDLRTLEDSQLMAYVAVGSEDAFEVLLERYKSWVLQIARDIVKDTEEAKDLVQHVFDELYRTATRFDPSKGNFATWLFCIAHHDAINRKQYLEIRHFYDSVPIDGHTEAQLSEHGGERGELAPQEKAYLTEESLAMLKPRQRKAIALILFEGLTAKQAAARTGESVSVVENNLFRGLKKLTTMNRARTPVSRRIS